MLKNTNSFVWSDNWYIEGDKAWLINGWRDILLSLDLKKETCNYIAQIPNSNQNKFRLNSRCIKIGDDIFCMPDIGDSIWVYGLTDKSFRRILVDNPNHVRLSVMDFWCFNNKLYFLSTGLKKIGEVNLKEKVIERYYILAEMSEERLAHGIKIGSDVYCVSLVSNKVYQFSLLTKALSVHLIPVDDRGFSTISFDGHRFWLSGYKKKIYIWNREDNSIESLDKIPGDLGVYDFSGKRTDILDCTKEEYDEPLFVASRVVGRYVWYIPFRTNKILYIDKNSNKIQVFEMEAERETRESLTKHSMDYKFVVDYVVNQRYIGLFSLKNNWLIEIDAEEMKSEVKKYTFICRPIKKETEKIIRYIMTEDNPFDKALFLYLLDEDKKDSGRIVPKIDIGYSIYKKFPLSKRD